jgi:hypothetical protein
MPLFICALYCYFDEMIEVLTASRAIVIAVIPIVGLAAVQDVGIGLARIGINR